MPINKRILVAEDEEEIRSYLQMALRCQGYSVELAQDGEEALRLLRQMNGQVGAVLLDVIMPRKDGIEALEEIRASYTDVPVIMTSGYVRPQDEETARGIGVRAVLLDPRVDLRQSLEAILMAELVDNDSWQNLVRLAAGYGEHPLAARFHTERGRG